MIEITNPKIAGFSPRWAPFPGITLLFNNPGNTLRLTGNLQLLDCSVADAEAVRLYGLLDQALQEIDPDALAAQYLFCPLPPSTYHVTVFDGVNKANLEWVHAAHFESLQNFLQGLPESLHRPPPCLQFLTESALLREPLPPVRFVLRSVEIWPSPALVARLQPADAAAEAAFDQLCIARETLRVAFVGALGVGPGETLVPHVTLGYFAGETAAQPAYTHLAEWNAHFHERAANVPIEFRSVSLYGFSDMITFFKTAGI